MTIYSRLNALEQMAAGMQTAITDLGKAVTTLQEVHAGSATPDELAGQISDLSKRVDALTGQIGSETDGQAVSGDASSASQTAATATGTTDATAQATADAGTGA